MRFNAKQLKDMSNAVRAWALHAVRCAGSGHVGIVLGASDIITSVFANFLRRGVDKFVLSAGHGSAMLYAVLKLAGYDVGDLEQFRKIGGLPGHPERGIDGVDVTTGPLGQGVANAVGMALAAKIKKSDARIYCLCSDGDLMEGVAQEAIAFAGRYRLDNLVLLWDDNGVSIDGVALTDVNVPARMAAAGWNVCGVRGDDFGQINRAIERSAKSESPTFIQCTTQIGRDSTLAGTNRAHGFSLNDTEMMRLVERYISPVGESLWMLVAESPRMPRMPDVVVTIPNAKITPESGMVSTRELSGKYIEKLILAGAPLIGGSADLGGSTNAKTSLHRDITADDFSGNYINYGVRESAMGAIMNGLMASDVRVYGSTFLVFSDYMRPAMRLAALSKLPVIYVLTHDSVAVGEDGPTHQPVEQLASLRLMPNMHVFRPCNGAEVATAWQMALADNNTPSCIVLSRQKIAQMQTPDDACVTRGAYVIRAASTPRVRATIIATGSEVPLAVAVAEKLGPAVQVVSMPSVSHFRAQCGDYKQQILRGFVVAIEASASAPWFEFADTRLGIDDFGMSGSGDAVYKMRGFDADAIARDIKNKIK